MAKSIINARTTLPIDISSYVTPENGVTIYRATYCSGYVNILFITPKFTQAERKKIATVAAPFVPMYAYGASYKGKLSPATASDLGLGYCDMEQNGVLYTYYEKETQYGVYGDISYLI